MKMKIAIVILAIVCVGLGIAFYATKQQSDELHKADASSILDFSNQLVDANLKLDDLHQVNLTLTNDLALSQQQTEQLSNNLTTANAALDNAKTSLTGAQGQITNLNSQINDLELQNKVLDQRANDLTNTIAQLNSLIESTQDKLAVSETNNDFLQSELEKQVVQKNELEHKFNDLNEVRAQVKKLRDELFVARRLQLMKNDNGNKKGAELLMQRRPAVTNSSAATVPPNYNLNVEVGSDGSVRVIPPLGATNSVPTNSPAP
jgi:chromosome segregation ATPase